MSFFMDVNPTFYACRKKRRFYYNPTRMGAPAEATKGQLLYVPALPGVSLFMHRAGRDWAISEGSTGLRVVTAPARWLLHGALQSIINRGADYTRQAVQQRPKLPSHLANPSQP